jgi:hypothetical protein
MKALIAIFTLLATFNLSACKPDNSNTPQIETPKVPLFEEQRNVLESAKGVNQTQQQQTAEQKKLIEQQTQ